MFGATNIVKNSYKSMYVCSGCWIAFDGADSWGFGNKLARNVVIFGVDNTSSFHNDYRKKNILRLG